MIRHTARVFVLAAALVLPILVVQASTPRFWRASTQAELLKGEVEGLSVDPLGRLVLGPVITPVYDATVPFIWCLAAAPDGMVYAGTGNEGQVLRVDRQGRTVVWFDSNELEVHALAVGADGALFVGTSPDGRVYRVDASGKPAVFFDPDDKYIWSLTIDAKGRLYVGTGEKGLIYRVAADGSGAPFYKTPSTHVTALAWDRQGQLLAGTDSPGRVLRIDDQAKGFVLLDSPFREIRALRVDASGRIFAAAVNGKPAAEAPAQAPSPADPPKAGVTPSVSAEITAISVMDMTAIGSSSQSSPKHDDAATPKGAVLRLDADGTAEVVWQSSEDIPFDVAIDEGGSVLLSTGNGGKIYRVTANPADAALVARVSGKQATAMVTAGALRYVATSNPARLVTVGTALAAEGSYVSEARDAGTVATWGTLSWKAAAGSDGRLQVFTRAGNTSTPDDTWSAWAGPYERADGEPVRSPSARYFQWKVVLSAGAGRSGSPALASISVAYLQRNLRPRVEDITVHPPGVVFQRPYPAGEPEIAGLDSVRPEFRFPVYSMPLGLPAPGGSMGPALGRRIYQKGLRAFAWQAKDGNDDRLVFDLHFRRVEEAAWRPLRLELLDQVAVWDTTSVADGSYILRVTASDRLNTVPAAALSGEMQTAAFDIDNTPPAIAVREIRADGQSSIVVFDALDSHSVVERVEYSVEAGPWQMAFPEDGAADARRERYAISVGGRAAGRVVIRATDTMNNTGTARVEPPPSPR